MATKVSVIGAEVDVSITATVTNGATTTTDGIDLGSRTLCGITFDSDLDGTSLGFTVAPTLTGTYATMHTGVSDYSKTVAASRYVKLDPADFAGVRYLKPVLASQTGSTTLTFHVKQF